MKRNKKYTLQLALSACLAISAGNALAADEKAEAPDTSNWVCKFCVVPYGWYGDLKVSVLWVDDPTPKFADYRGLIDDDATTDAHDPARHGGDAREAGRARDEPENEALGEELAHHATPARPERGANGDLTCPVRASGEERARDVRARDQQHQTGHPHQSGDRFTHFL